MPKRKNKKQHQQKLKLNIPIALMTIGIFFISLSTVHWYFKFRSLSLSKQFLTQYFNQEIASRRNSIPTNIYSPWFIDTPITEQVIVNNIWTVSEDKASHLASSSNPGDGGNIIIYGHNKRKILGNIRAFKGKEIITITTADGGKYKYQINKIVEVDPRQTEFLKPTNEEVLTIYTCSGFMDTKRFIVQAKPI